jgi:APA family basic amino acid/polyamine antiporter
MSLHKVGFSTAASIVIANMIGTGVFTSLGFQLENMDSVFAVLMLWVTGGIIALCGAFCYGEIGAAFPESGGEYNYLTRLYRPVIGFLSGWVSVTVGFAAPIAAASVALGLYVSKIYPLSNPLLLSVSVIVAITAVHSINLRTGSIFQRGFTWLKVGCIVAFILAGFFAHPSHQLTFSVARADLSQVFSPVFAGALVYVLYAYSGWNAASYISGEIKDPEKNLPGALLTGTLVVMIIYTLLNFIFLYTVPAGELRGVVEVGYVSAIKIFGQPAGRLMSLVIAILLVSTISAMILAGPRVIQSMGKDIRGLRFFSLTNTAGVPYVAIISQSVIAIVLALTSSFESIITYVGFTLNIFTFLTVAGVFILRRKFKDRPSPYRTPLYPLTPIIFLLMIGWISVNIFIQKPVESLYGLGTVLGGMVLFVFTNKS